MGTGALLDDRSVEERQKDYRFEEMVTSADPVNWEKKDPSDWRKFPIFDQDGSGSCVAQTGAKMLGVNYWLKNGGEYVHFSATDIYQRRKNRPSGGMIGIDALSIMTKGTTLEALVPSQDMNDSQMDTTVIENYKRRVGDIFRVDNYVVLPTKDIDTIASVIQKTGKAVMVWFYFTRPEWKDTPVIKEDNLNIVGSKTVRHSVTAVDFGIYKGKKGLVIEDSWGESYGWDGRRFITEDFFKERNFFAGYCLDFKFEEDNSDITKPKHYFTRDLFYVPNVTRDEEVSALQDCLKYLGYFPKNIESTGWFGSITKKAVMEFQSKYGITPVAGYIGVKTRAKLNQLFA